MTRSIWRVVALLVLCLPCYFTTRTSLGDSRWGRTAGLPETFDRESKKYKDLCARLDAVSTEILVTITDNTLEPSQREANVKSKKVLQADLQEKVKLQRTLLQDLAKRIYKQAKSQKMAKGKR